MTLAIKILDRALEGKQDNIFQSTLTKLVAIFVPKYLLLQLSSLWWAIMDSSWYTAILKEIDSMK